MSELDQFVNKSKTATSVSNTDRVLRENKTVVDGASDNKALEMDTKRACVSANGTLNVDLCIHYIQRLIQTQLPKDIWGLDRVSRVLTELTLPICLDGLKVEHYNPESQICCNGVISNRDKHNKSCCHGEVIDNTAFLCCNDVKYERNESNGCCGTFEYDKRTKGCCGGMLHNISEKQTCCHENTELTLPGKCCNAMSIDGSCMSCVNDTLAEITLDASTDLCCRGMGKKRSRVCSNGNLNETVTEGTLYYMLCININYISCTYFMLRMFRIIKKTVHCYVDKEL
ncbi:uncharacterized protein LOC123531875 isoform X2 [Mercenaria mercenaria]|nr:uncharacterized protein LOC123531875 isoform X2 [Mercenaria mercenaria]